MARLLKCGAF